MSKYSNLKIFHYQEKLDSLGREITGPVHIRIKPTNICNHNCWYCCYRSDNLQLGKDMVKADYIPMDKMADIIVDIYSMGVKAVTFSGGGEPLCYPYIWETMAWLADTDIKFGVLTNGSKLDGKVANILSKYGSWVRVSMDGWDDESYSKFRKVPAGEYTKIMNNMREFKKVGGRCHLGVSLIVGRANYEHISGIVYKLKEIGVDSVKISPCIVSNDGKENNEYHKEIYDEVRWDIRNLDPLIDDDFEIVDSYHELDDKFSKNYTWCPYLQILTIIGADCNVYSCQDKAYTDRGLIGSIKDKNFKEFWFEDSMKFYRIDPIHDCNHHCVANAKNKMIIDYLNIEHEEFV